MKILEPGSLTAKCRNCGCRLSYEAKDAFKRGIVCGMINSGTFDREWHVFVRCPQCCKRVDVTEKLPLAAVPDDQDDPLCKCGPYRCHCED